METKKLKLIAEKMGIQSIKQVIKRENDKLRTTGRKDIANAVDEILKLC